MTLESQIGRNRQWWTTGKQTETDRQTGKRQTARRYNSLFTRVINKHLYLFYKHLSLERGRDRQTDRQTDRQGPRQRQTDRQTRRDRDRQTQRKTKRETDRHRDRQTARQTGTDRQTDRHRERQRERQRQTDRQRQRQAEPQAEIVSFASKHSVRVPLGKISSLNKYDFSGFYRAVHFLHARW